MKKALSVLFLLIMIFGGRVYAQDQPSADTGQEPAAGEEVPSGETYQFPVITPSGMIFGGYRFVSLDGSPRADEYDYLHDSISLGGNLSGFNYPNRYHLDLDFVDKKDYFADAGYSYEDIVLFRGINRTLYHNLDNINLAGGFTPNAIFKVNPEDEGVNYGVRWGMTTVSLRFKTPNYPFHVFIDGSLIDRDGTMQQRFLSETGSLVRTSRSRDVDWETKELTVGTNAHLGPVEIEYSHGEKRFDPGGSNVLNDFYAASSSNGTVIRNAGIYPHNLVPDLTGSSDTVRLHTSYTGRIVASATFTDISRSNNDSGAKADYFLGAGEVTWMAATNLAVFVKYRHKETDIDSPLTVTFDNICATSNYPSGCVVLPPISSISDTASATVRYRPLSMLTLLAEYDYDRIRRENNDILLSDGSIWHLPARTEYNTASLSADMRVMYNLNLRAGYVHKEINDPAYNTDPDHSDEGHATISWTPIQRMTTFVTYSIAKEKRDDLNTEDATDARNRDVFRDRIMGAVTYLVSEKVSLTGSYLYIHDKIRQDIAIGSPAGGGAVLVEPFVPDTDLAQSYGLNINYIPNDRISLAAGVSYTLSSGAFSLTDTLLASPVSVGSLSAIKTRETDCSLSGEYRFRNGFAAGVRYRYINFDDVLDNPWDDVQDGRAHIILLTLSKKW
jgi:predicted porin